MCFLLYNFTLQLHEIIDALKLKRGELALVLDGARVRVVEVRRAPKAD